MKRAKKTDRRGEHRAGRLVSAVCAMVLLLGGLNLGAWAWGNARLKWRLGQDSWAYHSAMDRFFNMASAAETSDDEASPFWPDVPGTDEQTEEAEKAEEAEAAPDELEAMVRLPHFGMPVCVDIPLDPEPVLQPVFEEFYGRNPDLIGWIEAGGEIDYPIVWRDNAFYMDHDFDGEENIAGAIFLDERNAPDMNDASLIVYGHNMRVGTMFGQLDLFRDVEFARQNPIVRLHSIWEERPREYVIFSIFDASMNVDDPTYFWITRFGFASDEEKGAFFQSIKERSLFDLPVDVDAQDQIVCLVTCSYSQDNGRLLLYARRVREGEVFDF